MPFILQVFELTVILEELLNYIDLYQNRAFITKSCHYFSLILPLWQEVVSGRLRKLLSVHDQNSDYRRVSPDGENISLAHVAIYFYQFTGIHRLKPPARMLFLLVQLNLNKMLARSTHVKLLISNMVK